MKYKNYISASLLPILFSVVLIASACSEKSDNLLDTRNDQFASGALALYEFEDAMEGIEDATLANEMGFYPYFDQPGFPQHNGEGFRHDPRHRQGPHPGGLGFHPAARHLGGIFRELELSGEQMELIHDFMYESRECLREPFAQFREAARPYIQAANDQRREIIQQVQNGLITREEARVLIEEINAATREAIQNCPECIAAMEAMCACKLTLFDNISSILNEDQLATWNEWVEGLSGPCFDDNG